MARAKRKLGKTLSTAAVARHVGVTAASVANWIDQGLLKAGRTPGGHRRVAEPDLVAFLWRQKLPVPPELERSAPRVLVAGEPAARRDLVEKLRQARPAMEVREAGDGFATGEMVATWLPDVLLLDLHTDGLDGLEVCRLIKGKDRTKNIEIIAMASGRGGEAIGQHILRLGARACFRKPLDVEALLRELDAALGE